MRYRIISTLLYLFLGIGISNVQATVKDYPALMDSLLQQYHQNAINDSAYLDLAYKVARHEGMGHPEFIQKLTTFRHLVLAGKKPGLDLVRYYRLLAINEDIKGNTGGCIFYIEKELAAYKQYKPNEQVNFRLALFLTGLYQSNVQHSLCVDEYKKVLPDLEKVPRLILRDSITSTEVVSALTILQFAVISMAEYNRDTAGMTHAWVLSKEIHQAIRQKKPTDDLNKQLYFIYHIQFYYHRFVKPELAMQDGYKIIDFMKSSYVSIAPNPLFEIYLQCANFLAEQGNVDSAQYYLQQSMANLRDSSFLNMGHVYEVSAFIAAQKGNYRQAYEEMQKANEKIKKRAGAVLNDRNNNLYAEAEMEETALLLQESEQKKALTEKRLFLSLGSVGFVLLAGAGIFTFFRQKQKSRFLEFKLNMARNIHDETNPALLYAMALTESAWTEERKTELTKHLEHTSALIRSLSHDLKSDQQHNISDIVRYTEATLDKLNINKELFKASVKKQLDKDAFISHYQFNHIKAILNECITNTIKHADFEQINITFQKINYKLCIIYSDDGAGWAVENIKEGIGIKNIKERCLLINAEYSCSNHFPEGYDISITIPLR